MRRYKHKLHSNDIFPTNEMSVLIFVPFFFKDLLCPWNSTFNKHINAAYIIHWKTCCSHKQLPQVYHNMRDCRIEFLCWSCSNTSISFISTCTVVFLWFNPVTYYISEDAGVVIMTIERRGANGIPVNVSIITVDLNATGTKAKKKNKKRRDD